MGGFESAELSIGDLGRAHPEVLDANLVRGFVAATVALGGRAAHGETPPLHPVYYQSGAVLGPGFGRGDRLGGRRQFGSGRRQCRVIGGQRRGPVQVERRQIPVFSRDGLASLVDIACRFTGALLGRFLNQAHRFFLFPLLQRRCFLLALRLHGGVVLIG